MDSENNVTVSLLVAGAVLLHLAKPKGSRLDPREGRWSVRMVAS